MIEFPKAMRTEHLVDISHRFKQTLNVEPIYFLLDSNVFDSIAGCVGVIITAGMFVEYWISLDKITYALRQIEYRNTIIKKTKFKVCDYS